MKISFTDDNKDVYSFSLGKSEDKSLLHISKAEILVYGGISTTSGARIISNDKLEWGSANQWIAPSARQFIERVLKLKAFL